jgi:hypothetical protein
VFFLQRPYGGNGNHSLDSQLFKAVNVGAEVQFAGEKLMPTGMAGEERYLAARERPENVSIRGISERSLLLDFVRVDETRHVVQTAAADYPNLCLLQMFS